MPHLYHPGTSDYYLLKNMKSKIHRWHWLPFCTALNSAIGAVYVVQIRLDRGRQRL